MLLCDIGNSSYHFYDLKKNYKESVEEFDPSSIQESVYYICVHVETQKKLQKLENWIDLSLHVDKSFYYETMGVDRIFACEALDSDAIIIDAGSALTVDVVKDGTFEGGFIYPGIKAMQQCYRDISSVLEYPFNFDIDLDYLAKNSQDAISYGYLKTLYQEVISHNLPIILTGGDAYKFVKIFKDARVDELLLFRGMEKIIHKSGF